MTIYLDVKLSCCVIGSTRCESHYLLLNYLYNKHKYCYQIAIRHSEIQFSNISVLDLTKSSMKSSGPMAFVSNIYIISRNLYSWAGRRGYRTPRGNQFLIDVSRFKKYHRKRFAMLKS